MPTLFGNFSTIFYWRIDLGVKSQQSSSTTGVASLTLKKNQLPTNGTCYCQETTGTSLLTYFNVICKFWIDPDGTISSYQFMGNKIDLEHMSKRNLVIRKRKGKIALF